MTRSSVLVNLAAFSVWLLVPYFLARVPAYSLAESGAILATAAAGAALAAPIGARLAGRRISAQQLAITGAAAIGLLFLGAWTEQTPTILRIASLYTIIRPSAAVLMAYARSSA
jgi:hypothetical protein